MSDPTVRTLRLLSLLQSHRHWTGEALADRLEVSLRTLRRDVERLRELGYPVAARTGTDGGYQLEAGAVLPPLVLDDDEAVALVIGLLAAAQSDVTAAAEASARALAKVVPVLPRQLRRRVDDLSAVTDRLPRRPGPVVDPAVLTQAARACRDSERIDFGYTSGPGVRTQRRVEPHRLVSLGQRWYLVAHDLDRGDWRSFRLDRLERLVRTGGRFAPRALPAADAAQFVRAGIAGSAQEVEVVVDVELDAHRTRERLGPWARVSPTGPDRCRLQMRSDTLQWPCFALGSLGAELTVVSPPQLRDELEAWSQRFGRAAARPPPPTTAQLGGTATSRTAQRPTRRNGSR